ncbi:hypothetical protein TNCV_988121 [Trichonephila clavipes]|nr:hypothetical protein TNCV_988121 [Trichonephila clavipes]
MAWFYLARITVKDRHGGSYMLIWGEIKINGWTGHHISGRGIIAEDRYVSNYESYIFGSPVLRTRNQGKLHGVAEPYPY